MAVRKRHALSEELRPARRENEQPKHEKNIKLQLDFKDLFYGAIVILAIVLFFV